MFFYEDVKKEVKRLLRVGEDDIYDEDIQQFYKTTYWQLKSQLTALSPIRALEIFTKPNQRLYERDSQGKLLSSELQVHTAMLSYIGETGETTQLGNTGSINYPLKRIEASDALIWQQTPSQPYYWDYFEKTIRFYPTPDKEYLVTFVVQQAGASDSDDIYALQFSDDFLHAFRLNIYLMILQNVVKDHAQAQLVQSQLAQEVQRLTTNYRNQINSGNIRSAGLSFHTGRGFNRSGGMI